MARPLHDLREIIHRLKMSELSVNLCEHVRQDRIRLGNELAEIAADLEAQDNDYDSFYDRD